jgi:hypothetical protein
MVLKRKRYGGFEEVVIMDVVAWGGHVVSGLLQRVWVCANQGGDSAISFALRITIGKGDKRHVEMKRAATWRNWWIRLCRSIC